MSKKKKNQSHNASSTLSVTAEASGSVAGRIARELRGGESRQPPDDPESGLVGLLARQHAERQVIYRQFKSLWDQYTLEGMRDDLARLSATRVGLI